MEREADAPSGGARSRANLPIVAAIACAFAVLSLLFSFLSWGAAPATSTSISLARGLPDIVLHFTFGFLVGLCSRRWPLAVAGGLMAMAVDMDHLGRIEGLPMSSRGSHSIGFMVVASAGLGCLATLTPMRKRFPALLVALLAAASVVSHIALDAVLKDGKVPLWAPVSFRNVEFSQWQGAMLQLGAMLAVWIVAGLLKLDKERP